jgi:hypothetical protein
MLKRSLFVIVALFVLLTQTSSADVAILLRLEDSQNLLIVYQGGDYDYSHKGILFATGRGKANVSACGVVMDSTQATHRITITADRCNQTGFASVLIFNKGLYTFSDTQKAPKTGKG